MNLSKIEQNGAANFSNLLVSPHATLQQQRIMVSAIAAFVPSDESLKSALNAHMVQLELDLIQLHQNEASKEALHAEDSTEKTTSVKDNPRIAELNELKKNARIMDNINIDSDDEGMQSVRWGKLAILECVKLFFDKYPSYLRFKFNIKDFMGYWSPGTKLDVFPSKLAEGIAKAAATSAKSTFEFKYEHNNQKCRDIVPIFSQIQLVDENEVVDVELNSRFMPFLVFFCGDLLKLGYTALPLNLVKGAKSEFTLRMCLAILRRYHDSTGTSVRSIDISIKDLREELGVVNKHKRGNDFCKHVIDIALKDINSIIQKPDTSKGEEESLKLKPPMIVPQSDGSLYKVKIKGRSIVGISITFDPSKYVEIKEQIKANKDLNKSNKGKRRGKHRDVYDYVQSEFDEEESLAMLMSLKGARKKTTTKPPVDSKSDGVDPKSEEVEPKGVVAEPTEPKVDEKVATPTEEPKSKRDSDLVADFNDNGLF
ncbi:hypothetical protein ACE34W_004689 [Vibrio parahaemolyticus]